MHLVPRARRRLDIDAGLISAPVQSGGLGLSWAVMPGEDD